MKILQIINSHALQDGGAQRLALEMHHSYLSRGHDSHLLSLMSSPANESDTYTLDFESPYGPHVLLQLRQFLSQPCWRDVDIIHVHLFPAQFWVAVALWKLRLKARLVTTEHNTFNRRRISKIGRFCDRITFHPYELIVCISSATKEALELWQPQVKNKLVTISNGIQLRDYSAKSAKQKQQKPAIMIAVGRITEQKNYHTAISAVAALKERNFELWIAGQDEMNGQMQQLAEELGVAGKIRFLGYQADIPSLLEQADIFLLTSKWEGFGLAVVEAMAAGLPVIVSDVPGVREVVAPHSGAISNNNIQTGFLIDPSSPTDVALHLGLLLDNDDLREQMGKRAKERAKDFDITHTINSYLQLYEALRALPRNVKRPRERNFGSANRTGQEIS